ncbi:MAG: glycoside hydrolase family 2 protein [Oscillospiraceae bacterium]|jgi:beta-galactosidase|nr:glycoside hydrolase family 2 protein [Oscillospiraceae bacterium]
MAMKQVFNINQGWLFSKTVPGDLGQRLPDAERVNLPHTWNTVEGRDGRADTSRRKCAYQKDLPVPAELDKIRIYLEFQGVNAVCELFIDGTLVGTHHGGYSAFRFDITPFVTFGKTNVITVTADNSANKSIYPLRENTLSFGGIYRDVNLVIAGATHFALDNYGAPGIYVVPRITKSGGKVGVTAEVASPINYDIVSYTVYDSNGCAVGSAAVPPKQPDAIITIKDPELWQGRKNPYLYTLKAKLLRDGELLDSEEISFGFRALEVRPESGFYLNGVRTTLRGVTRQQDRAGSGWAMTDDEQLADIRLIKEMGANAVRLPYYQNDRHFYDLCDKEGIIVWTELPVVSEISASSETRRNIHQQIFEMLKQCYNHPSICFFGVHSDIQNSESSEDIFNELSAINRMVKQIDKYLLTASANTMATPAESRINEISDLVGYNVYLGWDYGRPEDFSAWAMNFSGVHPDIPLAVSEYGAEGLVRYHSENPQAGDFSEDYQALYHEKMLAEINKFDFLWASFAASMFDYSLAEPNPKTGTPLSHMGLVSYDRQTKKDAFYFYKSQWSRQRFVYIASRRYAVRTERKATIKVYSNCNAVALIVNGKEHRAQKKTGKTGVFHFDVRLIRGENTIRAVADEGLSDEITIIRKKLPELSYSIHENLPPKEGLLTLNTTEEPAADETPPAPAASEQAAPQEESEAATEAPEAPAEENSDALPEIRGVPEISDTLNPIQLPEQLKIDREKFVVQIDFGDEAFADVFESGIDSANEDQPEEEE